MLAVYLLVVGQSTTGVRRCCCGSVSVIYESKRILILRVCLSSRAVLVVFLREREDEREMKEFV